jgi:hypothetical protein
MESISFSSQETLNIVGVQESVIYDYFLRLNQCDFEGVSSLFSVQGCLYPPFEKGICGRDAILQYLQAEAIGVKVLPKSGTLENEQDGGTSYQITGQVKTNFFTVNVGWSIQLNVEKAIVAVEVKLLAELQDLLNLKRE